MTAGSSREAVATFGARWAFLLCPEVLHPVLIGGIGRRLKNCAWKNKPILLLFLIRFTVSKSLLLSIQKFNKKPHRKKFGLIQWRHWVEFVQDIFSRTFYHLSSQFPHTPSVSSGIYEKGPFRTQLLDMITQLLFQGPMTIYYQSLKVMQPMGLTPC